MKANKISTIFLAACAALAFSQAASAAPDFSQLKGMMGGGSSGSALSSLSSSNMGNAAGVVEYCAKNNYLSGNSASTVKDQVLSKLGAQNTASNAQPVTKSTDYLNGVKGVLSGSDGQKVDLGSPGIKDTITKKVCDTVLKQAKSFL